MKLLILSALFIFSVGAAEAACKKKIDNSKVVMFVDTNESNLEIETAEKAACDRGQRIVIVPKNYKEYTSIITRVNAAKKAADSCMKASADNAKKCESKLQTYQNTYLEQYNFNSHQAAINVQIRDALETIKNDKATVENFTISGHDGGGHFGGQKSQITRQEVLDIFEDYKDINKAKSIFLLGCYTGVPREVMEWMEVFPDLRILAGYDGSAPLASRPEGHEYLYDLLMQEKALTTTADEKKLKSIITKSFKSIKLLNAAMYLKPICQIANNEKAFYYGSILEDFKGLSVFDPKECEKIQPQLQIIQDKLRQYNSGELESPSDTVKGEMRGIYSKARRFEHCFEKGTIGASAAFGLLFSEGLKDNFANFYKDDLKQAENTLTSITQAELDEAYSKLQEILAQDQNVLDKEEAEVLFMIDHTKEAFEAKFAALQNKMDEYEQLTADPKYKTFLEKFPQFKIGATQSNADYPTTTEEIKIYEELGKLYKPLLQGSDEYHEVISDINGYVQRKVDQVWIHRRTLETKKSIAEMSKLKVEDLKSVWIPTKENLKGKSRKEILKNLYAVNGILTNPNLPDKLSRTLRWSHDATTAHMYQFDIPFSWHEFTGNSEAPRTVYKLDDYLKAEVISPLPRFDH